MKMTDTISRFITVALSFPGRDPRWPFPLPTLPPFCQCPPPTIMTHTPLCPSHLLLINLDGPSFLSVLFLLSFPFLFQAAGHCVHVWCPAFSFVVSIYSSSLPFGRALYDFFPFSFSTYDQVFFFGGFKFSCLSVWSGSAFCLQQSIYTVKMTPHHVNSENRPVLSYSNHVQFGDIFDRPNVTIQYSVQYTEYCICKVSGFSGLTGKQERNPRVRSHRKPSGREPRPFLSLLSSFPVMSDEDSRAIGNPGSLGWLTPPTSDSLL
jgi:hypothetical protein